MTNPIQPAMTMPRAIRPGDVQALYGVGKTRLFALMKTGELRTTKVGRARFIPVDELERLFVHGTPAADAAVCDPAAA